MLSFPDLGSAPAYCPETDCPRGRIRQARGRFVVGEPHNPAPKTKRCPRGMTVQTIIFPRSTWSASSAREWARGHGFKAGKVDTTSGFYRFRQWPVSRFTKRSFRTIGFGRGGIQAVVGCPKRK